MDDNNEKKEQNRQKTGWCPDISCDFWRDRDHDSNSDLWMNESNATGDFLSSEMDFSSGLVEGTGESVTEGVVEGIGESVTEGASESFIEGAAEVVVEAICAFFAGIIEGIFS